MSDRLLAQQQQTALKFAYRRTWSGDCALLRPDHPLRATAGRITWLPACYLCGNNYPWSVIRYLSTPDYPANNGVAPGAQSGGASVASAHAPVGVRSGGATGGSRKGKEATFWGRRAPPVISRSKSPLPWETLSMAVSPRRRHRRRKPRCGGHSIAWDYREESSYGEGRGTPFAATRGQGSGARLPLPVLQLFKMKTTRQKTLITLETPVKPRWRPLYTQFHLSVHIVN